ncbi:ADP-ribose binding module macro domain-containing protein [Desulfonema limicola]|uniref:ADP-ribose binding module macro domain-containing protein n=1 Tax=Desulfonema limicola TaxID=45656 RepID=A0A975BE89_9BACT|nr:O-acetyl-ADP-ribose deacetylase [Desulfonema limicola]QTA83708.1 ADP-ribose binding module macro domain-containing protein [Desulfonema limicola]
MKDTILDRIEIYQGDITKLHVDAIVNAANNSLLGGGGVDGAIHRAAGPKLLEECKTIGGCPTGEARITRGYNLPAKYIIHTAGPIYSNKPEDSRLLSSCYYNSLKLAEANNIKTIAFPAISCGVYGYPLKDGCQTALDTSIQFLKNNPLIEKIIFVVFSDENLKIYNQCLKEISIRD